MPHTINPAHVLPQGLGAPPCIPPEAAHMVCEVVAWLLQTSEHHTGDLRAVHGHVAGEAEAALVVAGQKFLAVVQQNPEDARALGNWGNALCLRAELAQDAEVCFLKPHLLLVHPLCICRMKSFQARQDVDVGLSSLSSPILYQASITSLLSFIYQAAHLRTVLMVQVLCR